MLFSLRSTALFSASIAASLPVDRSFDLAEPVVAGDPDELAVPALLVPGGGEAILAELPAPLGSLPELLRPPTLAGPDGTPLTPAVPAPGEPAFGEPAALPVPAEGPLAAPPALLPPPLPLWANEMTGETSSAIATMDVVTDVLVIPNLPLRFNDNAILLVPRRNNFR